MNATSSRSHAIFTITIERSEKGPDGQQHLRMGKLHMVDLAVSHLICKKITFILIEYAFNFIHSVLGHIFMKRTELNLDKHDDYSVLCYRSEVTPPLFDYILL